MEYVKTYLDDLLILIYESFSRHLLIGEMVLARIFISGIRANASKSKFLSEQNEYLGYWIIRKVIQPVHNKAEAILDIMGTENREENPKTTFIVIVNYYCITWLCSSGLLDEFYELV
jgi:hypothetical protein